MDLSPKASIGEPAFLMEVLHSTQAMEELGSGLWKKQEKRGALVNTYIAGGK